MKILAVTPCYPPDSRVGAWLATHTFLAHAVTRGHDVAVIPRLTIRPRVTLLDGVHVLSAKTDMTAAARDADVVVTHVHHGAEAASIAGRPCVQMSHGGDLGVFPTVNLVVANSKSMADVLDDQRAIVCHPYTNPDLYRVDRTGTAVTLVNTSDAKGGPLFWRIVRNMPDRQFLAIRGGYGNQTVERHPHVTVERSTPNMRDVYSRTRILLVPSAYETWGMVAVEAMCSGIPVIAHPTPGLRESLGDAGIFVDRNDGAAWVEKIAELDNPDVYEAKSAGCLERFKMLPDHRDRFVDALEALL